MSGARCSCGLQWTMRLMRHARLSRRRLPEVRRRLRTMRRSGPRPPLGAEGLAMRVVVEYEAEEVVSYDHHVYVDAGESFKTRPVRLLRQPVEVAVRLEGRYLTPIGNALAAVAGNAEGRFSYESHSAGAVVEGQGRGF